MNEGIPISEVPMPSYGTILLHSGPLGLLLHLLTFLSVFVFLWLVWKKASSALLFLVALMPLLFLSFLMQIGFKILRGIYGEATIDPSLVYFTMNGMTRVLQVNSSISAGLCVIAIGVVLARRKHEQR